MWVLSHTTTGERFYLLSNAKKFSVGRTLQSNLCLPDDSSVSREHAVIHRSSSGIRIEDKGSKYGVFVNEGINTNTPIPPNEPVDLKAGHIVRFGRLTNIFRLENIEFNVCTSTMSTEEIVKLKKQLKIIDGKLQGTWSTDCTHLVMTNVTVTVKVLQSLAFGIPIVSPEYFDTYIQCVSEQKQLPDVNEFIPEITEPYVIKEPGMMQIHLDRQRLFQNKTFIFMVKRHMDKFAPIIKLASGNCINMEEDTVRKSFLLRTEYIPVQYTPSANTQCSFDIEQIVQYVQSHNRRLVSESEIGLAIIHRAIDRFCNPDRKMVADFQPTTMNKNEMLKKVLADDTPHVTQSEKPPSNSVVIPESVDLTGTEPNNNRLSGDANHLNKPSASSTSTRRSNRSSTKAGPAVEANASTLMPPPKSVVTPKKNQKRKHDEEVEQQEAIAEQPPIENDEILQPKKQKTVDNAKNQGEMTSVHIVEPLPKSQSDLNFSGFIRTQNRFNRNQKAMQDQSSEPTNSRPSPGKQSRKRVISMLTADSDEEKDDDNGNVFNFSRKTKRTKATPKETTTQRRVAECNTLNVCDNDDDDDEECGFNFSKKPARQSQTKQKSTQNKNTNVATASDIVDASADLFESQNSYKKPFQPNFNRSFNRTLKPVEIITGQTCNADWIACRIKKELNLDESHSAPQASSLVKIKDEKLEEWEMTDEEKKRQWKKSMANIFEIRKVDINITRRSMIDETDSLFSESERTAMSNSKNFKRFVKKNNFVPQTVVIKTSPVPVMISKYSRM